jgi:hypothetical protein
LFVFILGFVYNKKISLKLLYYIKKNIYISMIHDHHQSWSDISFINSDKNKKKRSNMSVSIHIREKNRSYFYFYQFKYTRKIKWEYKPTRVTRGKKRLASSQTQSNLPLIYLYSLFSLFFICIHIYIYATKQSIVW